MTDVIFFDYWLLGTRHFSFLNKELKKNNYSTLLLHVGSWRDKTVQRETEIDDIFCRDISCYNNSLIKAIKTEKPSVVVLLNQQTEDRILVRVCRELGIKTVFIMHGIIADTADLGIASDLIDSAFGIKEFVKRIPKYKWLFFQYLQAASQRSITGILDAEIFKYFACLVYSPGKTYNNYWKFKDLYPDVCLVYSKKDKDAFISLYGFKPNKVEVIGNYNLDSLFLKSTETNKDYSYLESIGIRKNKKAILYIEGGFFNPGYAVEGWSLESIKNEIFLVHDTVKELDLHLIVKLHPSSNYLDLEEQLAGIDGLSLIKYGDLERMVIETIATIGQSSTTLRMPIAVHKPLIIISFPPQKLLIQAFVAEKVGKLVENTNELRSVVLSILNNTFEMDYEEYTQKYILPFDGRSQNRIADKIISMLDK